MFPKPRTASDLCDPVPGPPAFGGGAGPRHRPMPGHPSPV